MLRSPPLVAHIARRRLSSASAAKVPLLLSPKEYKKLPQATTIPLDVSWHMPNSNRSPTAEFLTGPRVPGARRFDLDDVAELDISKNPLSLVHMLPSKARFEEGCAKAGITNETHVVVYDTVGVFSSPRAAWTFKTFGHDKVSILDGGLPRWIAEGNDVEVGEIAEHGESEYHAEADHSVEQVRTYEQIVENSSHTPSSPDGEVVLDHRPLPRYLGDVPEPRPGIPSGHIPNSLPLAFTQYLQPASDQKPYSSFRQPEELRKVLADGVGEEAWAAAEEGKKGVVFSCGSGMTAAVGWIANELVREAGQGGAAKSSIYDESWTGYAQRKESKVVKGPPEAK